MANTVELIQDEYAENPRRDMDYSSVFAMAHRRHSFGDKNAPTNMDDIAATIKTVSRNGGVVLPVYMYDHSGITIRTTPFECPWDSGQIGYIWMTREAILENFMVKRVTERLRAKACALLASEIDTLDQYLTGDVWGAVVKDENGETLDSCFGFYGREYAEAEAQAMLKAQE